VTSPGFGMRGGSEGRTKLRENNYEIHAISSDKAIGVYIFTE